MLFDGERLEDIGTAPEASANATLNELPVPNCFRPSSPHTPRAENTLPASVAATTALRVDLVAVVTALPASLRGAAAGIFSAAICAAGRAGRIGGIGMAATFTGAMFSLLPGTGAAEAT